MPALFDLPCTQLVLGPHRFDIRHQALVAGVVDDAPGGPDGTSGLPERATELVEAGVDLIEVGVPTSADEAQPVRSEDLDRTGAGVEAIVERFDVPVVVRTCRAALLRAALDAGAVGGRDGSGFADPEYLVTAADAGASVIVAHEGSAASSPGAVIEVLSRCAARAIAAGIPAEGVVVDAGTAGTRASRDALALLRASDRLVGLGHPVSVASESTAGHAVGIARGCRLIRTRGDARGARRAAGVLAAVLAAREQG
jgi:dihydropteroate synthase